MQTTPYRRTCILERLDDFMNSYRTSAELKDIAKEKLTGKYGSAMVVSPLFSYLFVLGMIIPLILFFFVPYLFVSIANQAVPNEAGLFVVIMVIVFLCAIILGVLKSGIALFYLNIACGRRHKISDIFYGFRWQFQKSLALSAITIGINLLCMAPYYLIFFFSTYFSTYFHEPYWYPLSLVCYILGAAANIYVQIIFSQCFYLLLDFPQKSAMELLKLSNQVMKGHKKRYFYIMISFLPLQFLSACSFNIGDLWLYPYQNMTYTLFFLDIMQPQMTTTN